MQPWVWIVLIAVAVIVLFLIFTYNALVRLRNMVDEAWNQISVQLKRRHDLIPNLVNAVKGYMDFEQETLTRVIEARSAAVSATERGPGNAQQAAQAFGYEGGSPTFQKGEDILDRNKPLVAEKIQDGDVLDLVDAGGGVCAKW